MSTNSSNSAFPHTISLKLNGVGIITLTLGRKVGDLQMSRPYPRPCSR
jgi:hypothetical protein